MKIKDISTFLKNHPFIKHITILLSITLVLLIILLFFIKSYTGHGKFISVPDFSGLTVDELNKFTTERKLKYEIFDSVYDKTKAKGSVVSQDPFPNAKVKEDRVIYLTIVSRVSEKTSMPNLIDLSLRQAIAVLETNGLKVGGLEYIPDLANNAVLKQKHRGAIIKPGTIIEKGSTIDLVLGDGLKKVKTQVPFLYGYTRQEAIKILNSASLNIGAEIYEDSDTSKALVTKQKPEFSKNATLYMGETVDLWYKSSKNYDFEKLNKMKTDTAK